MVVRSRFADIRRMSGGKTETSRRRRRPHLRLESLESRLALAGNPLATLVVVTTDGGESLVGGVTAIEEGQSLAATVQLTRRPVAPVLVSFKSADALQVTTSLSTLRFTRTNWRQTQTVRFAAIQDAGADGDRTVPVAMRISLPSRPQAEHAVTKLRIDALDSGLVNSSLPAEGRYTGRLSGPGTFGAVSITYADGKGVALFRVNAPKSNLTTARLISADFEIAADNKVQVTALSGIAARNFTWDAAYQSGPDGRGLSGTLTVRQPASSRISTMLMSATLKTPAAGDPLPSRVTGLRVQATAPAALTVSWVPPSGTQPIRYLVRANNGASQSTDHSSTTFTGLDLSEPSTFTVTAMDPVGIGAIATASWASDSEYNLVPVTCVGLKSMYDEYLTSAYPSGTPSDLLSVSFTLRLQYNRVLTTDEVSPIIGDINEQAGTSIAGPFFNQETSKAGYNGAGFDINSTYINLNYFASSQPDAIELRIPADVVYLEWQLVGRTRAGLSSVQPTFAGGDYFVFENNGIAIPASEYPLDRGNRSLNGLGLLGGQKPVDANGSTYLIPGGFAHAGSIYKIDKATSQSNSLSGTTAGGCNISYVMGVTATSALQQDSPSTLALNGIPAGGVLDPYSVLQFRIDKTLIDGVFDPYQDSVVGSSSTANYVSIGFHTAYSYLLPSGTDFVESNTTTYGISAVDIRQVPGDENFYYVYLTTSEDIYEAAMNNSGHAIDGLPDYPPIVAAQDSGQRGYLLYNDNVSYVQGAMLMRIRNGNYVDSPYLADFKAAPCADTVSVNSPYEASWIGLAE